MEKTTSLYKKEDSKYMLTVNIGELAPCKLLANRIILITGGSRGIGYSIAKKCILQGAKVIITGRDIGALNNSKRELGPNCEFVQMDMCHVATFYDTIKQAATFFGNIDSLVNNAGISLHESDFLKVSENGWDTQINTNLKGPFFLSQAWLRYYEECRMKNGRIIMMASDTSGMGSTIPYGISKAGISSFTRGLAKQLIKKGIRINAIAPGTTKTAMTDDFTQGEIIRDTTVGNRLLFPDEISEICLFLLSDASTCISGNIFGCTEGNICFDNTDFAQVTEEETNP